MIHPFYKINDKGKIVFSVTITNSTMWKITEIKNIGTLSVGFLS